MSSVFEPRAALVNAVCATVAYADLFDFPLDEQEIYRDLVGVPATFPETRRAIADALAASDLALDGGLLTMPDRSGLTALRRLRTARARALWPVAYRFGHRLAALPFVRMVGVSGSLAANNPDADADVDYVIVSVPRRLWLVRAGAVAMVRIARRAGAHLCPNYLLSTRALTLAHRDLYTAHELLQVTPIAGDCVYQQLRSANAWTARFLPNRSRAPRTAGSKSMAPRLLQGVAELVLPRLLADHADGWEARRKVTRLAATSGEAQFTPDVCEGHYGHNRRQVLRRFADRCRERGIWPPVEDEPVSPAPVDVATVGCLVVPP
jgi:hypothetical protein